MTQSAKKMQEERIILRRVYGLKEYPDDIVEKRESPDFVVNARGKRLGVEVTKYFQDKTSSRYNNIPHYLHNILVDGKIKKGDKLSIVDIGITNDNVTTFFMRGVYREYLSAYDRLNKLSSQIQRKSKDAERYLSNLSHIDLIIYDAAGDLFDGTEGRFIRRNLIEQSSNPLIDVSFRKIFICGKNDFGDAVIVFTSQPPVR